MNKISKSFKKGPIFVAYITAGQKDLDHSFESALSLIKGGVDILEIGVPFSDPVADGPTIQKAMVDALKNNTTVADILKLSNKVKQQSDIPIILFSYYNPILQQKKDFYKKAKTAGVDGILIVDLPIEESIDHVKNCKKFGIDPIFIVAPSTNRARIKKIAKYAKGFIYYACRKGTTGMKNSIPSDFADKIKEIKQVSNLPVIAGFGIASSGNAKKIIKHADGFVVGSLFVDAITEGAGTKKIEQLAKKIDPRKRKKS